MMKPSYERIKFLQNQLRTAIQNHHVLLLKSRITPQDTEIKNQMNILQSLIISMGRTQNDLLEQLQREIENNIVAPSEIGRHLSWFIPQNVPIYSKSVYKSDSVKPADKPTIIPKPPRVYSRTHSLLKPKDSESKDDLKNKSVLKSKFDSSKECLPSDNSKVGDEDDDDEDTETGVKRRRTDGEPNSRSCSVSPKPIPTSKERRKIVESKLWTRSKKRLHLEAATAAARAASFSGSSEKDINELEEGLKNEPIDPNMPIDDKILQYSNVYEEMGKTKFLESFRLISMSERDAIRAKKCVRKRRTAAGQSNFYNDYFQPAAMTLKNPKWRYEMLPIKRAPRDPNKKAASILDGSRRGSSPIDSMTSGEVTPEDKSSPKSSPSRELDTSDTVLESVDIPNSSLAEADIKDEEANLVENRVGNDKEKPDDLTNEEKNPAKKIEVDNEESTQNESVEAVELEEDVKDKLCIICRILDEDSILETCIACNEKYHPSCSTPDCEGKCKYCFFQISGLRSEMGHLNEVSSSSSMEIIKRYLTTT